MCHCTYIEWDIRQDVAVIKLRFSPLVTWFICSKFVFQYTIYKVARARNIPVSRQILVLTYSTECRQIISSEFYSRNVIVHATSFWRIPPSEHPVCGSCNFPFLPPCLPSFRHLGFHLPPTAVTRVSLFWRYKAASFCNKLSVWQGSHASRLTHSFSPDLHLIVSVQVSKLCRFRKLNQQSEADRTA
jgi:hypothetical protein